MDPLKLFEEIYGQVPEWVSTMHAVAPDALSHYTELRTSIMKDGALTRKEKELILIGINAARRYETSMLYHTEGAVDAGASPLEIADAVLTAVISRGLPAWLEGQKAVEFALESVQSQPGTVVHESSPLIQNQDDCDRYYLNTFGAIPGWAELMKKSNPDMYICYTNLRNATLKGKEISAVLKELILAGINTAERYSLGVQIHAKGALEKGASKAQLAECFLVAVLTAGIPAWFTGFEYLNA